MSYNIYVVKRKVAMMLKWRKGSFKNQECVYKDNVTAYMTYGVGYNETTGFWYASFNENRIGRNFTSVEAAKAACEKHARNFKK